MKKNHEILDDLMGTLESTPELTDSQYHFVKMAMDQFAEQEAIEFGLWISKAGWQPNGADTWENWGYPDQCQTGGLYELFNLKK